ncbi:UNVERIFIED_CONTAM: hypothetical protein PYX00_003556 [Menopon gallinae]|uniref:Uncharacterized protein n=1 Tax=Menopon gallinae TaxID=328185 RepID=A0AAW2I268_9NEOP
MFTGLRLRDGSDAPPGRKVKGGVRGAVSQAGAAGSPAAAGRPAGGRPRREGRETRAGGGPSAVLLQLLRRRLPLRRQQAAEGGPGGVHRQGQLQPHRPGRRPEDRQLLRRSRQRIQRCRPQDPPGAGEASRMKSFVRVIVDN